MINDFLFQRILDFIENPNEFCSVEKLVLAGTVEVMRDRLADNEILEIDITPEEHTKYFQGILDDYGYDRLNTEIERTYYGGAK